MSSSRVLYWGSGSPPCWRVLSALAYKGIPYDEKVLNFEKKEHKSDEVLALNPRGELPVFKDGDAVVNESGATLVFLEIQYPEKPMLPSDVAVKAQVYQRLFEALTTQMVVYAYGEAKMSGKETPDNADMVAKVKAEFKFWDDYASEQQFIATDTFTLADAMFGPFLLVICRYGATLKDYPNLKKYADMLKEYEPVKKTMPPHWADETPKYTFMNIV